MEAADRELRLRSARAGEWLSRNGATLALGLSLAAAAVVLLSFTWNLTFYQDTWEFLMNRRTVSPDTVLQPHNEHILVIPILLEQLELRLFGMTSARPEDLLLVAAVLVTAVLVFVYVRRRLGGWPAALAAVVLLFLGPAWEDILWPFQICFIGSTLFGVAMLLALDRDDRPGDLAACAFAVISVAFVSLGLAFIAAAGVDVLVKRTRRGLRRAYVAAVPLLLYAIWWAGWGHDAESHLSLHNLVRSPVYVLRGFGVSLGALLGLSTTRVDGTGHTEWGTVVLLALLAWLAVAVWRGRRIPARALPAIAAGLAFWGLAALNYFPGREPWASRYVYGGAVFAILIAAELLQGLRLRRSWLAAATALAGAAVVANLAPLREGRDKLERQTELTRADLGAIQIARRTVSPEFRLTPDVAGTPSLIDVTAGDYLDAVREYGSPAYDPAQLARAPELARRQADVVLSGALPLSTKTLPAMGMPPRGARCVELGGGRGAGPVRLSPGTTRVAVAAGPPARMALARYAVGRYPVRTEAAPGDSTMLIGIPADASTRPWRLRLVASQPARVCPAAPPSR